MMRTRIVLMIALIGLMLAGAGPARAADGVVDIRPDGISTYVISSPGSYLLVSDVSMTTGVPAIEITASNVTLDLNGHTITGNPAGPALGITYTGGATRTTLFNGRVIDFSSGGVLLPENSTVRDLSVISCEGVGLTVGADSTVTDCTFSGNTDLGFSSSARAILERCHFMNNLGGGANLGLASKAIGCIFADHAFVEDGTVLLMSDMGTVRDCVFQQNTATAGNLKVISFGGLGIVQGNLISSNTSSLGFTGLRTGDNSQVIGNTFRNNQSTAGFFWGIEVFTGAFVESNQVSQNYGALGLMGILADNRCTLNSNRVVSNTVTDAGSATGIRGYSACHVEGNLVVGNKEGPNASATATGIKTDLNSTLRGNTITDNSATGAAGASIGIYTDDSSLIEFNNISLHQSKGPNSSFGIQCFSKSRIANNALTDNFDATSASGSGISVNGSNNVVTSNSTSGHSLNNGLSILGGSNYIERNHCQDGFTINGGNTTGTGGNENIDY